MADTTHTLEIRTTLKDGISGPAQKAGAQVAKLGQQAASTGASFQAMGNSTKKGLGLVANGISAASSATQGLEKNVLSIGMNLASGFAFGGPWGLAIAGISTGIGVLIEALNEAEEAEKRFSEGISKRLETAVAAMDKAEAAAKKSSIRLKAVQEGKDPDEAVKAADREEEMQGLRSKLADLKEKFAREKAALEKMRSAPATEEELFRQQMSGVSVAEQRKDKIARQVKYVQTRGAEVNALEDRIANETKVDANEAAEKETKAANEERKKAAEDAAKSEEQRVKFVEEFNRKSQDAVQVLQAQTEMEELLATQAQRRRDTLEQSKNDASVAASLDKQDQAEIAELLDKQAKIAQEKAEREKDAAEDKAKHINELNEQNQFELDMIRATSAEEKLRVQQQRELNEARSAGLDVLTIEKRHAEEMKQLLNEQARDAQEKADKDRERADKRKQAEKEFIDSIREQIALLGAKSDEELRTLEKYYARKRELEAAAASGPGAVKATKDLHAAQDQAEGRAAADAARKANDPLKGWNADMGMGPLAYLRQQKKQDRQRKKWERTAANLRAEARDRMGFTVGEEGGGWGVQPGAGDMDYQGKGGGAGDPAIVGGEPAPQNDGRTDGDPANKVADSAKTTADASKQQAESLGKAAEAAQSMATEATAAKDAAATSADAATQSSSSLKEAASSLKDASTAAKDAATAAGEAAGAAKTLATDMDKLKADIKRLKDALKLS